MPDCLHLGFTLRHESCESREFRNPVPLMAHRRVGNILQYLVCKMNVFVFVAKSQQFYSRTLDFKGEINKMARSRKIIKNDNGMLRARHLNPLLLICVSQNETLTGSQNWCGEGIVILSSPHNIWLRLFVIKQFAQLTLFPSGCRIIAFVLQFESVECNDVLRSD